uniref:Putative secreted peptide n=1 Tax=Anopheles braziliensis TaxID=58242 RepID=A0A2M3ZSK5_9DIPT
MYVPPVAEIMIALLLLACISISICRSPSCIAHTEGRDPRGLPFVVAVEPGFPIASALRLVVLPAGGWTRISEQNGPDSPACVCASTSRSSRGDPIKKRNLRNVCSGIKMLSRGMGTTSQTQKCGKQVRKAGRTKFPSLARTHTVSEGKYGLSVGIEVYRDDWNAGRCWSLAVV